MNRTVFTCFGRKRSAFKIELKIYLTAHVYKYIRHSIIFVGCSFRVKSRYKDSLPTNLAREFLSDCESNFKNKE